MFVRSCRCCCCRRRRCRCERKNSFACFGFEVRRELPLSGVISLSLSPTSSTVRTLPAFVSPDCYFCLPTRIGLSLATLFFVWRKLQMGQSGRKGELMIERVDTIKLLLNFCRATARIYDRQRQSCAPVDHLLAFRQTDRERQTSTMALDRLLLMQFLHSSALITTGKHPSRLACKLKLLPLILTPLCPLFGLDWKANTEQHAHRSCPRPALTRASRPKDRKPVLFNGGRHINDRM